MMLDFKKKKKFMVYLHAFKALPAWLVKNKVMKDVSMLAINLLKK